MEATHWRSWRSRALAAGILALACALPALGGEPDERGAPPASEGTPSLSEIDIDSLLTDPKPRRRAQGDPAEQAFQNALSLLNHPTAAAFRARARESVEALLGAAREALPPDLRASLDRAVGARGADELVLMLANGVAALVLALLAAALLRGHGDVTVSIEYPAELRGTFTVRIAPSRSRGRNARKPARVATAVEAERAKRSAPATTRTQHPLVSRETQFRGVRSGRYCVSVEGFLQAADGDAVLSNRFEEQDVRLRRGRTVRVAFDLHLREYPVDVFVVWDKRRVEEAMVAVRGAPGSLRFARGGPAHLGVDRGRHTLLVGSGDRVAECEVEVTSFQPTQVEVDLGEREALLFSGCPPAVAPFLNGDVSGAARALERDGQTQVANLLLARAARQGGEKENAARHYEAAGHPLEAAQLRRDLSQFEAAAALFERAGELRCAADMYRAAGELVRAGDVYESVQLWDSAVECFREAGEIGRWVEALERRGQPFEAAKLSLERKDWGRAIRSLQLVAHADPNYPEAARLLADAYRREGHLDLAVSKVEELVRVRGVEELPMEDCDTLVKGLEDGGDCERALSVLEMMRRRDATWPGVATRIETLRKRRSRDESPSPSSDAAAFTSEFRYEILEELGRGGMGIVFKARDRRLGRVVALKRLPDNLRNHPKAVALFLREARAAAALNHPNIVTLFDAGQEGDTYYITMELLTGWPMHVILKRRGRLTPGDVCRLGAQIANGLQYAHEQRIVHRDIKTANLFFTDNRKVKIMDFGLAKMTEEVRRAATVIGGTPYYMAPEQSQGAAVDHRADIYALGVTFFELLAGKVPFSEGDVAFHHRHTPPPDVRERAEGVPDALAELVAQMIAKKPEDRCESAGFVRQRLQEIARSLSSSSESRPS